MARVVSHGREHRVTHDDQFTCIVAKHLKLFRQALQAVDNSAFRKILTSDGEDREQMGGLSAAQHGTDVTASSQVGSMNFSLLRLATVHLEAQSIFNNELRLNQIARVRNFNSERAWSAQAWRI